jgi:carbon monoxide dehydrogenase subunit G
MPIDRFSVTFTVDAAPDEVHAHLADPRSWVGLSPLVVEVRDVRGTSYVAVERFRLGRLKWDNLIKVTMTVTDQTIRSEVVGSGAVRLVSTVELTAAGTGTSVTEHVEVTSPAILRRFVTGKARSVQIDRAAELARRMSRS